MGISPNSLLALNSKLVIVRISGFGQTGPYRERPGLGTVVEAMSGFADRNGFPDREPVLPPMPLADMVAGLYGVNATMIALREVETGGGKGQVVDLSLLEPLVSILGPEAAGYKVTGKLKARVYATSDGRWVALSASIQSIVERVFRLIGQPELIKDPRFKDNAARVAHRTEVDDVVREWVEQRTQEETLRIFDEADITAGPVYDVAQFLDDPHVKEREVIVELPDKEMGTVPMHNVVPRLSDTPGTFRSPAPALGEHTQVLLAEIGLSGQHMADLKARGVV
jgi:crotonobetainyl-CoA:carnitine CoA-transferase CaiB-like acyl-CoA transferase